MSYKPLNQKQEETIGRICHDYIVHVVDDVGDAYITFGHAIRVRIDKGGEIVAVWLDKQAETK